MPGGGIGAGMSDKPILYEGSLAVDDRGSISFVNGFDFSCFRGVGVKLFYIVSNYKQWQIRAWHAHKHEAKAVTLIAGAAIVAAVKIDNWDNPNPSAEVHRFVLSASKPSVLFIPAGYANGFRGLTGDARLMFFSSATVEESRNDDYRFGSHYWEPWNIIER